MFYCPNCKIFKDDEDFKFDEFNNITSLVNPRDGYGRMIRHMVCPNCKYILSGYIHECRYEKDYFVYIVELYSENKIWDIEKVIDLVKENFEKLEIDFTDFKFKKDVI